MWRWLCDRIDARLAEFFAVGRAGGVVPSAEPAAPAVHVHTPPSPPVMERVERWMPLPGFRLALVGGSGFEIQLNGSQQPWLYTLYDGDGRVLAHGGDLVPLKAFGEIKAAERAEFEWKDPKA